MFPVQPNSTKGTWCSDIVQEHWNFNLPDSQEVEMENYVEFIRIILRVVLSPSDLVDATKNAGRVHICSCNLVCYVMMGLYTK